MVSEAEPGEMSTDKEVSWLLNPKQPNTTPLPNLQTIFLKIKRN